MCHIFYSSCELGPFFFSLVPFWFTRVFCPFLCRMVQSTCNQVKNLYKCTLFTFASGKASCQSFLYIRFWRAVVCRVAPMATCVFFFHPAEFTLVFRNVHHVLYVSFGILCSKWDLGWKHFPILPKAVLIWQIIIYGNYLTFNDLSYDLFMNDTSQQVDLTCYSVATY